MYLFLRISEIMVIRENCVFITVILFYGKNIAPITFEISMQMCFFLHLILQMLKDMTCFLTHSFSSKNWL